MLFYYLFDSFATLICGFAVAKGGKGFFVE